jgi:hypothetical protein
MPSLLVSRHVSGHQGQVINTAPSRLEVLAHTREEYAPQEVGAAVWASSKDHSWLCVATGPPGDCG